MLALNPGSLGECPVFVFLQEAMSFRPVSCVRCIIVQSFSHFLFNEIFNIYVCLHKSCKPPLALWSHTSSHDVVLEL